MLDPTITIAWFLKVLSFYGMLLMHVVFLFAAGLLFVHYKNAYTVIFFFGLLVDVIANSIIQVVIEFRLIENMDEMQHSIQLLSTISTVAYFVQVIGFLLFVYQFIADKNNQ